VLEAYVDGYKSALHLLAAQPPEGHGMMMGPDLVRDLEEELRKDA
jgi:hypothetical protein